MNKYKGFTLVELLITVAIIALLSTIGILVYSQVLKNGRDAKRQADLSNIQSALEQYRADQGYYPSTITFGGPLAFSDRIYLKELPQDSKAPFYKYEVIGTTDYCLYAHVENPDNGKDITSCASTGYNLEVARP